MFGQVECGSERKLLRVPVEDGGQVEVAFRNGVRAQVSIDAHQQADSVRIIGDAGILELSDSLTCLRYRRRDDTTWHIPRLSGPGDWGTATALGIADLVQCLETGGDPELSSQHALRGTELVFAAYESCRIGKRADVPLQTEDSAFLSMIASGMLGS